MTVRTSLTIRRHNSSGTETLTLYGREAWALGELIEAGEAGCTPIDHPGPRWSGYVYKLRRMGFDIETRHECHNGPFPGHHARYVMRSRVEILRVDEVAA